MTSTRRRLDPDALAALEEERDFLLRSLDDLEAERAVGDIDEADYDGLKDDYTRRAAEVIRSVEAQEAAFASIPGMRWRQVATWIVGLAILGGLSGVLIARSSGARSAGDSISGDVRSSVVSLVNEARLRQSDPETWSAAIEIYEDVIGQDPSNVEALSYRAWLTNRLGGPASEAADAFREVALLDPTYPDAIVFHTIVLADEGRWAEAAEVLNTLDLDDAPGQVQAILGERGIVGEVYAEANYELLAATGEPGLGELGLDEDRALAAAGWLMESDRPIRSVAALKLYRAVLAVDPDNPAALSREAWILFSSRAQAPELEARAIELIDRAVDANPDDPEVLLTRASMLLESDPETACGDFAQLLGIDGLDDVLRERVTDLSDNRCP